MPGRASKPRRVAHDLVRYGLLIAFTLGLTVGLIEIAADYSETRIKNEWTISNILHVSSASAVQAAFQLDSMLGRESVEPLMVYDFVTAVSIIDDTGVVRASIKRKPAFDDYDAVVGFFMPLYRTFQVDLVEPRTAISVGRLIVDVHANTLLREFYWRSLRTIIGTILKNVLLTLLVLSAFHYLLSRPLAALLNGLEGVDPRRPRPFPLQEGLSNANNEITHIAASINNILDASKVYLRELVDEQQKTQSMTLVLHHSERLRAIGQLVGGVAHDFNNILAVIMGNLELIGIKGIGVDTARHVSAAQQASRNGSALTARLLAFARKQPLALETIRPEHLVQIMQMLLQRTMGDRHSIAVSVPSDLWSITGDQQQLESVILNLVLNARDAMPDGGRIGISACNVALDPESIPSAESILAGDYVCFTVTDHGVGMSEEVLSRAFEPFFSTKSVGEGTGLGLSMAHGYAIQSGGFIDIASQEGRGTTVSLCQPRTPRIAAVRADELVAEPEVSIDCSGCRVLLVEDNSQVSEALADMLATLNIETQVASDVRSALEVARSNEPIDVFLLDVQIPGNDDGIQLAEQIKKIRGDGSRIGFVTANPGKLAEKTTRLLKKPFSRHELERFIADLKATG